MEMKNTVENMEKSVQWLSDKYDDVSEGMKKQATEITTLKTKVERMAADNARSDLLKLQQQVNSLEKYSRRQNIKIHGLPLTANEDLMSKVNDIATELKLAPLTEADIEGLHGLPSKRNKIPAVILRFSSRITRDEWMEQRSHLKATNSVVYFLENLTALNKKLL
ncbi:hypothetical protein HPB48_017553 [Haemaphysalis longicornis]|uniref:Uncharacterized protein n=1 Tax=Haemaphysalis longicornis TaxID=44386 RepID=A0A9J6FLA6_HAELO|nr:hypothetical protein HPB48_017553 [Haemaphysalis longicornis]